MGCSLPGSPSMEFSRREFWTGLPCSSPGDLLPPEIQVASLTSPVLAGRFFITSSTPWKTQKSDLEINALQAYNLPSSSPLPVTQSFHIGNLHVGKVSMKNLLCEFYYNNIKVVHFNFCAALLSASLSPLFSSQEHLVILKSMKNGTEVTDFILLGLTDDPQLQVPLFVIFTFTYLLTLVGNLGMAMLILLDSRLHTPMYLFLSQLSLVDFGYSSTVTPKVMAGLLKADKVISYHACAAQMCFFIVFATVESYLLASLAYDRYAAVCKPLHYTTSMTTNRCACLVVGSYACGVLNASVNTGDTFSLSFCGSNVIHHFSVMFQQSWLSLALRYASVEWFLFLSQASMSCLYFL